MTLALQRASAQPLKLNRLPSILKAAISIRSPPSLMTYWSSLYISSSVNWICLAKGESGWSLANYYWNLGRVWWARQQTAYIFMEWAITANEWAFSKNISRSELTGDSWLSEVKSVQLLGQLRLGLPFRDKYHYSTLQRKQISNWSDYL